MRICVVSRRDPTRDPTTRALITTLRTAGNDVTVVAGAARPEAIDGVAVRPVAEPGAARGLVARLGRRFRSDTARREAWDEALRSTAAGARPDIVYPATEADLDVAVAVGAAVARRPEWAGAGPRDLVRIAPHDPGLSSSPAGGAAPFHTPGDRRPEAHPAPDRHRGAKVAVAARFTTTNPSRYLVAALERAGIEVTVLDAALDLDRVPAGTAAIVVVESPLPALPVSGTASGVPVLFWVHHGEHHLAANLRLARRYRAGAVLLAHSWHLAHRFAVPVHRFPFAVAPELGGPCRAFVERRRDVSMVGAGLDDPAHPYDRRREITEALDAALPGRTAFRSGVPPEGMAGLYGDSRIVLNEGGRRHYPITMRVFEALGAGALLLTEDLPGTDVVLRRGEHYVALDEDPVGQVMGLLADPATASIAAAGHRFALGHHTYDHRVDELLSIAAATEPRGEATTSVAADPLAALVDLDVDVQSVAVLGGDLTLPDRAVRSGDDAASRLAPRKIDAVVIGPDGFPDLDAALRAARRYVYAAPPLAETVRTRLATVHPDARVALVDGLLRADLGAPGYRMPDAPRSVGEGRG